MLRTAAAFASAAIVAAPSIAAAALVPTPTDPIFAAIEAHRAAAELAEARHADHLPIYEAIVAPTGYDRLGQLPTDAERRAVDENPIVEGSYDAWCAASEAAHTVAEKLVDTAPTTSEGVAAALVYLADWMAHHEPDSGEGEADTILEGGLFSVLFVETIAKAAQKLTPAVRS